MSGTFNVRDPEIETLMRRLSDRITAFLPANWGFTLFLYGTHAPSEAQRDGGLFYIDTDRTEPLWASKMTDRAIAEIARLRTATECQVCAQAGILPSQNIACYMHSAMALQEALEVLRTVREDRYHDRLTAKTRERLMKGGIATEAAVTGIKVAADARLHQQAEATR